MQHFLFAKMEGAGNDYAVIDNRRRSVPEFAKAKLARDLCRRAQGIGADGMIFVEEDASHPFACDGRRPDGRPADLGGNAIRCVARFAQAMGIVPGREVAFRSGEATLRAELTPAGARARLPDVAPARLLPGLAAGLAGPRFDIHRIEIDGAAYAVASVRELGKIDVAGWGGALRRHEAFGPEGARIVFMARSARHGLAIRTFEPGIEAETLSCAAAAAAAAMAGAEVHRLETPLAVETRGGPVLTADFIRAPDGGAERFWQEGPTTLVFAGKAFWPNAGRESDFMELMEELED